MPFLAPPPPTVTELLISLVIGGLNLGLGGWIVWRDWRRLRTIRAEAAGSDAVPALT
jgi:hypothetical protein